MAVYGVVGFVLLQIVDLAVPALLLPEWTYRFVAFLLLIGFPIAIIIAWAFELTARGIERTEAAAPGEVAEIIASPAAQNRSIGLAVLGTALLLIGTWWVFDGPAAESASASLDRDAPVESIAVLPFADMSPDGDQGYFGDGLAEELLDALARVEGLVVAARTSSFRFRGEDVDIAEVASRLGVQTVLEGSVRSGGDRVRITAQLVNADGFHLWSERYDRSIDQMEDLIRVQEEIAQSIVGALALAPDTLAGQPLEALVTQGTDNLEAYNALLRGRHLMAQRSPQSLTAGAEQFERAVALDPEYARAWANLGMANSLLIGYGAGDDRTEGRGREAVERALEIDPLLAEAHAALGYRFFVIELDFEAADRSFARAIELDPRLSTAWKWRGENSARAGDPEGGVPYSEKAAKLDPLSLITLRDLAKVYDAAERFAEADSVMASLLELEPDFPPAIMDLAFRSERRGDLSAAIEYNSRYAELSGLSRSDWLSRLYSMAGQDEEAVRQFRRVVESDSSAVPNWMGSSVNPAERRLASVDEFLFSLNLTEGPGAVNSFVAVQAPRVALVDSLLAVFMSAYASAVSGDADAARPAAEHLPASGNRYLFLRAGLAAALGDQEAILEALESIPEDTYSPYLRFEIEYSRFLESVREEPRYRAILEALPPYTTPTS
jgi:TolB-like protein/Tfp pilus assembly protein PilF